MSGTSESELPLLLAETFAREGVDPSYLIFVRQHLLRPDREWRSCCGSNCDPCVEQLGRLVDAARQLLRTGPPADPPAAPPSTDPPR